jgi:hypothetical protein
MEVGGVWPRWCHRVQFGGQDRFHQGRHFGGKLPFQQEQNMPRGKAVGAFPEVFPRQGQSVAVRRRGLERVAAGDAMEVWVNGGSFTEPSGQMRDSGPGRYCLSSQII